MGAHLEIREVAKSFRGEKVLDGASLEVARGEIAVVFGPSGGGKTALLNIVSGALNPDRGDILIGGRSVVGFPPESRGVGMAFQNFALYPHMTAFDNIASPLRGRPSSEIRRRVGEVAELLKIAHVLSHRPQALSNGQKQRTALARALAAEPSVLLLDDPLRNVDAKLRYETRLEMPALFRRFGAAVLYVTQDFREAMALGDRVAVLQDGRFRQVAPPAEVYESPANVGIAGLFGDPAMNIFPCEAADGPGWATIAGRRMKVGRALPPDGRFLAGARPEHIVLSESPGGENEVEAELESVAPMSIRALVLLKTADGREIIASCPEERGDELARGPRRLFARFPADKIALFERDGGRRVPAAAEE